MDKTKLLISLAALEAVCESSTDSSEEDELDELLPTIQNIRPRIRNYLDIVNEYSNMEFKSHFR